MADVASLLAATVARERGPILGALLRLSGSVDAAEEALQEAVLGALESWRDAVPANPGAWLVTAAKNKARDARRHDAIVRAKAPLLAEEIEGREDTDTVADDYLRLVFTCCDPALAVDNQIALTLKVVCGFTTEEIARAFVCSEATVSQRILRAKQTLEGTKVRYATPERRELEPRVTAVLGVVHAMFNEGHIGRTGPLMRLDLQAEALRLARLVCDLLPGEPEAFGLLALVAFNAARARSRVRADGSVVLLAAQDRSQWDRELLREGLMARARARSLGGRGPYVLSAELAGAHATAPTWESTDWRAIVALYDALVAVVPSPIVKMNRAIAVAMERGPAAGLAALKEVAADLADHHLFYATRADLLERAGKDPRRDLEKALSLSTNDAERALLRERLAARGR
ncbi:MAG: sigma-70 family RNA polymerase sigma factor [Myxococcales bacterium]|nr:sigma-70 family RNA polymerase sigma factor [Myxococcales bacterium]